MNVYRAEQIRNIALIAHGGSGKTSLVDAALFDAGIGTRIGKVDEGSSVSDYDPDEIKRRMSINLTVAPLEWRNTKINLLDTPGYADFVGEVMAGLRVADAAVIVATADKGVEVGTELAWRYANAHDLPRLIFVNKLDRENSSYERTLDALRGLFGTRVVPLTIPLGEQANLSGVVDLVSGKAFSGDKATPGELPASMSESVARLRDMLVETAVESDDDLMAKYLEGEDLSEAELRKAIAAGVAANELVPVLAGSTAKNIGIQPLLDALVDYAPSAAARSTGTQSDAPAAFVFKTIVDPQKGQQTYFRVYSGSLKSDAHAFNVSTNTDERLGQILSVRGKQQEPTPEVPAGDIGMVVKLSKTHTGDTLAAKDAPALPPIQTPKPVFTAAVAAKTQSDLDKMSVALARLTEEDPTLVVSRDPETAETLLAGMGESHVDIAIERLQRRFGVEVLKQERRVPYRETIKKKARAEGRHKKQTGGHGQFADIWLEIEPLTGSEQNYVFENKIVGGVVPREYVPGVEKGVAESLKLGFIAGCPMVHVRVALVDGKYHPVDSSSQAFETAAHIGMKEAVAQAGPVLLEPIMNVTIEVPEANMGDVNSDLNTKRARIMGMESASGGIQRITAQAPMAELLHYATDLRSITQGRGTFTMELASYEEVPSHVQQQVVEAYNKQKAEK
ncbi:MAG: elongation factor G-like protein [Ktedonobacterales bacterium]|jgi:elongation factor G|nr:MAG: elongation factor G-like protein [Ktedonobacterales bacterium]